MADNQNNINLPPGTKEVKLILVGDGGVGKTTFVKRLLTGEFEKRYIPTLGVEVHHLLFHTNRGPIKFNVWETTGQAADGLLKADGAIIMADVNSQDTFRNASDWHKSLTTVMTGNIPVVLVGNKVDIIDYENAEQILSPTEKYSLPYYEISVKKYHNDHLPFLWLTRELLGHDDALFVDAPAPPPVEFTIDEPTKQRYEAEIAQAAARELPEDDDDL